MLGPPSRIFVTQDSSQYDATLHDTLSNGADHSPDSSEEAALRRTLSQVTHDINNPLSIIVGNAQLLLELARSIDLDDDLLKPIEDIEEASQRLSGMVDRLNRVNDEARAHSSDI